jgi:hypothetical protein
MQRFLQSRSAQSLLVFGSRSHAREDRRTSSYQWNQGWGTSGYESCVVSFTPIAYSFLRHNAPSRSSCILSRPSLFILVHFSRYDANTYHTHHIVVRACSCLLYYGRFFLFTLIFYPLGNRKGPPNSFHRHATLHIHSQCPQFMLNDIFSFLQSEFLQSSCYFLFHFYALIG